MAINDNMWFFISEMDKVIKKYVPAFKLSVYMSEYEATLPLNKYHIFEDNFQYQKGGIHRIKNVGKKLFIYSNITKDNSKIIISKSVKNIDKILKQIYSKDK